MGRKNKRHPFPNAGQHTGLADTSISPAAAKGPVSEAKTPSGEVGKKKTTKRYGLYRFIWRSTRRWCLVSCDWNKIVGIGTLVLALTSLAGLYFTRLALIDGKTAFEATQRPFVSIGRKDGKLAEFVVPGPDVPDTNVGIKIFLQNGGQSAALTPNLGLIMFPTVVNGIGAAQSKPPVTPLAKPSFTHLVRYTDSKSLPGGGSVASLAPQSV